ncbi:histidine kinase [Sporolactobacillus sp. Y61]|uniref:histidine kinase n=1 Tax=Sporolactobacillus sp. Y61 TaxID=3160863 RepID=A0AAU8IC50_9BACL
MDALIDKLILMTGCLAVYLTGATFTDNVAPVLLSFTCACLLSYYDQSRIRLFLTAVYLLLSFFLPWFYVFLPLICYDSFFSKGQWILLPGVLSLAVSRPSDIRIQMLVLALLLLSACLRYRTASLFKLKNQFYDLRDTKKEMAFRLKKQNQDLLINQDTEVRMATLGERNRIAREIHDNVGHLLSRALLQTGALLIINRDKKTKEELSRLKETLSEAMTSIRSSVHDLYDESIDLEKQLNDLKDKFTFCPVTLDYSVHKLPGSKVNVALISIVREALSNMARHSNATAARIILREHPAFYQLMISDNGQARPVDTGEGIGLKNMQDRVEALRGVINFEMGQGFKIFISVPKKAEQLKEAEPS